MTPCSLVQYYRYFRGAPRQQNEPNSAGFWVRNASNFVNTKFPLLCDAKVTLLPTFREKLCLRVILHMAWCNRINILSRCCPQCRCAPVPLLKSRPIPLLFVSSCFCFAKFRVRGSFCCPLFMCLCAASAVPNKNDWRTPHTASTHSSPWAECMHGTIPTLCWTVTKQTCLYLNSNPVPVFRQCLVPLRRSFQCFCFA